MDGHAAMPMGEQHWTWKQRLSSREGWRAISHNYVMNWSMPWRDIGVGLLIAGALGAWVPDSFWQKFFLLSHPMAAMILGCVWRPADCSCVVHLFRT
ncbi:permease [Paraburkholderia aromaticivorans]|uniref:permease n=1 Tax=Paraburkholderia aromaticivorans TaxID=2026199 RepID=UPI0038BC56E6